MLAATEPVPPALLAQLVELPTDARRGALRRARRGVRARRARLPARACRRRLPLPDASRRVRVRRALRARRPDRAPVGPGARDARDHRVQAADRPGADLRDPRRQRRRDAEDVGRARLRRGERARAHARQPHAVLDHARVPRAARASTRSPISRRSPTSCPESSLVEALERGLRGVDVELDAEVRPSPGDDAPSRSACRDAAGRAGGDPRRGRAVAEAAGARGLRLAARVRAADRRGPGRRSTARSRSSARAPIPRTRASRSTAFRCRRHDARVLAAEQAGRLRHDRARSAGPADRRRAGAGEPRAFPVGRLDLETEGLLMLTNDGELAELLTHPRHGVEKAYLAEVEGVPSPGALRALREGVELDDGPARAVRAQVVQRSSDGGSALEIVLKEGRKRIVRRMCSEIGHPVRRLVRTRIGPLTDPKLAPGRVPAAHAGRGAGAVRRRARRARGTPRLTCDPVRVLALRGATTCRREHQGRGRRQDAAAGRGDARAQRDRARRPRQHHLHGHRRHHRRVPGHRGPGARARRRAAALRPRARRSSTACRSRSA